METIFDKLGIYDFFANIVPGMFLLAIVFYIGVPLPVCVNVQSLPVSLVVILYVLCSFVIGILMQEIGSAIDDHTLKVRKKARRWYLSDENFTKLERKEIEDVVEKLSNKKIKYKSKKKIHNRFSRSQSEQRQQVLESVFYKCKTHLENHNAISKSDRLNAMFAMSRDMVICNISAMCYLLFDVLKLKMANSFQLVTVTIYIVISTVVFIIRAKRFAAIRLRTIFRQYIDLCDNT